MSPPERSSSGDEEGGVQSVESSQEADEPATSSANDQAAPAVAVGLEFIQDSVPAEASSSEADSEEAVPDPEASIRGTRSEDWEDELLSCGSASALSDPAAAVESWDVNHPPGVEGAQESPEAEPLAETFSMPADSLKHIQLPKSLKGAASLASTA